VAPFEPVYRDGRSGASLIAELVEDKPYGTVLTHDEIAECLGIDASDLVRLRSAIARAKPRTEKHHQRALEAVPNKGYRVIYPGEHARLATGHRRKSDRQIKRAISIVKHADERSMTEGERERNRQVGMALNLLYERQADTEARVARLEELMLGKHKPKIVPGSVIPPLAIEGTDQEIREGLEAAERGETEDLGSFEQYAGED
jgi:hypothetical protein